jgi:hypothetical protein
MKNYPYKKVIMLFTLAPMIGGCLVWVIGIFSERSPYNPYNDIYNFFDFITAVFIFFWGFFMCSIFGEIAFIIPAFVFSLIYAGLKLTRQVKSFFIILLTVLLGMIPFIPTMDRLFLITPQLVTLNDIKNIRSGQLEIIALAVVSSLIMAWFALPKPEDLEEDE